MRSQLSAAIEVCKEHKYIDGKEAILEMKENGGRNWKQMEWVGFYYEYLIDKLGFKNDITYLSPTNTKVKLDYRFDSILTDLKTHNINSKSEIILNDKKAMEEALEKEGKIQILLLNGYANKEDRDTQFFKKWHCNLKKEKFEQKENDRLRKTDFKLLSIYLLEINEDNKDKLTIYRQGGNSNGKPRYEKFKIKMKDFPYFCLEKIDVL